MTSWDYAIVLSLEYWDPRELLSLPFEQLHTWFQSYPHLLRMVQTCMRYAPKAMCLWASDGLLLDWLITWVRELRVSDKTVSEHVLWTVMLEQLAKYGRQEGLAYLYRMSSEHNLELQEHLMLINSDCLWRFEPDFTLADEPMFSARLIQLWKWWEQQQWPISMEAVCYLMCSAPADVLRHCQTYALPRAIQAGFGDEWIGPFDVDTADMSRENHFDCKIAQMAVLSNPPLDVLQWFCIQLEGVSTQKLGSVSRGHANTFNSDFWRSVFLVDNVEFWLWLLQTFGEPPNLSELLAQGRGSSITKHMLPSKLSIDKDDDLIENLQNCDLCTHEGQQLLRRALALYSKNWLLEIDRFKHSAFTPEELRHVWQVIPDFPVTLQTLQKAANSRHFDPTFFERMYAKCVKIRTGYRTYSDELKGVHPFHRPLFLGCEYLTVEKLETFDRLMKVEDEKFVVNDLTDTGIGTVSLATKLFTPTNYFFYCITHHRNWWSSPNVRISGDGASNKLSHDPAYYWTSDVLHYLYNTQSGAHNVPHTFLGFLLERRQFSEVMRLIRIGVDIDMTFWNYVTRLPEFCRVTLHAELHALMEPRLNDVACTQCAFSMRDTSEKCNVSCVMYTRWIRDYACKRGVADSKSRSSLDPGPTSPFACLVHCKIKTRTSPET